MNDFLLDTNIIIDVINGRHGRPAQVEDLLSQSALLACTSINITEIYMGMRPHEASATNAFLKELEFYPVTKEVAQVEGLLFNEWRQKGQTLGLADLTIAAVCLVSELTLVTDNLKHFPMPQLRKHSLPPRV